MKVCLFQVIFPARSIIIYFNSTTFNSTLRTKVLYIKSRD
ncbi:hypothetical protein PPL_02447 [Heterostelium album PN500]|uniref:Uncharacterized protein n=1 Tax=Heterostelium pallidum (strain ATCC 26659 / Pp 5 / PN500) TaxID=670386 RepID=D3B240_HETP5|nr:hypothetical protein PPL_02447 [Heterostelium album PN500]EFA84415.1 hypothetical protein PPL_02447 [Heterostelium album PN500]|eukprot:XP_020436529.1 hypothetical protein PPL_02447 [Heterostelium album PN500]